jgi:hypothetical protein
MVDQAELLAHISSEQDRIVTELKDKLKADQLIETVSEWDEHDVTEFVLGCKTLIDEIWAEVDDILNPLIRTQALTQIGAEIVTLWLWHNQDKSS